MKNAFFGLHLMEAEKIVKVIQVRALFHFCTLAGSMLFASR